MYLRSCMQGKLNPTAFPSEIASGRRWVVTLSILIIQTLATVVLVG